MLPTTIPHIIACATCVGDPGDVTSSAANAAIFLMLGVLGLVLGSFISFIVYLARRSGGGVPSSD
ncbi:hypothetical protein BH23VER1_BH23VER1_31410 [soil metagenome]